MAKVTDALVEAVRKAAEYNSASRGAPDCILLLDGDRQFENALPLILKALPEMLVYHGYGAPWSCAQCFSPYRVFLPT